MPVYHATYNMPMQHAAYTWFGRWMPMQAPAALRDLFLSNTSNHAKEISESVAAWHAVIKFQQISSVALMKFRKCPLRIARTRTHTRAHTHTHTHTVAPAVFRSGRASRDENKAARLSPVFWLGSVCTSSYRATGWCREQQRFSTYTRRQVGRSHRLGLALCVESSLDGLKARVPGLSSTLHHCQWGMLC